MALKNTDGNYLKIKEVTIANDDTEQVVVKISYNIYSTENSRINGVSGFEAELYEEKFYTDFNFVTDQGTAIDNFLTGGYNTLKNNDYSGWLDA